MSFDVYFQGFANGEANEGGADIVRRVLAAYIVQEEPARNFALIEFGGGSAELYLGPSHMMADRVSGDEPWTLLVDAARAANWVILPVGLPTCITDESQRAHLPAGLDGDAVLVTSAAELLAVIRSS